MNRGVVKAEALRWTLRERPRIGSLLCPITGTFLSPGFFSRAIASSSSEKTRFYHADGCRSPACAFFVFFPIGQTRTLPSSSKPHRGLREKNATAVWISGDRLPVRNGASKLSISFLPSCFCFDSDHSEAAPLRKADTCSCSSRGGVLLPRPSRGFLSVEVGPVALFSQLIDVSFRE